jgi:hypothetical protein
MNTVMSATGGAARTKASATPARPARATGTKAAAWTMAGGEAKKRAAAILEVLAGVRTPSAAAVALGVSVPRYYLLEERALQGLVQACEAQPKGRGANLEAQRVRLERECQRWQRDCARQQALLRAAQRTIGLTAAPVPQAKKVSGRRRSRRPTARALRAVARLQTPEPAVADTAVSTAATTPS